MQNTVVDKAIANVVATAEKIADALEREQRINALLREHIEQYKALTTLQTAYIADQDKQIQRLRVLMPELYDYAKGC